MLPLPGARRAKAAIVDRRYVVHDEIGVGGMSVVYRATDLLTDRAVALKLLEPPTSQSSKPPSELNLVPTLVGTPEAKLAPTAPELLETDAGGSGKEQAAGYPSASQQHLIAIANEFKVLASLRHPHVIKVYDYGFDAGQPYLSMELLEDASNFREAAKRLPPSGRVGLGLQLLEALAYLHRHGVLHRDVKPGNVLVTSEGQVKLLDFGVAALRDDIPNFAGTLSYMAPEVYARQLPTEASDLFAVGVMLFEALTGRYPFDASNAERLREQILNHTPEFGVLLDLPTQVSAGNDAPAVDESTQLATPEQLKRARGRRAASGSNVTETTVDGVLRRLMAKRPENRYGNAASVIADLSEITGRNRPQRTSDVRESYLQSARFIGRRVELEQLEDAARALQAGVGGFVLLAGESGVGKSRLLSELRTRARVRGLSVQVGQAIDGAQAPYQIWRDPLRSLLLGARGLTDNELSALSVLVPDAARLLGRQILPFIAPDPTLARDAMFGAVMALLAKQSGPLLLMLEDLHWMGPESQSLLERILPMTLRLPLLIVGSYRDDERATLAAELGDPEQLKLGRLSERELAHLTTSVLGDRGGDPALVGFLAEQTEGNAFFAVEVLRALAEEAGSLEAVRPADGQVMTSGMDGVLRRRLNRVPSQALPLLELAAISGRQFDLELLAELAGRDDVEELLLRSRPVVELSEDRWRFSHDKLREALLSGMRGEQRRAYHESVGRYFETRMQADRRLAPLAAHHFREAGLSADELIAASIAGEQLLLDGAYARALESLERAMELQNVVPELEQRDQLALSLQLNLGTVYLVTRGFASKEMRWAFDRAGALARRVGAHEQLFRVLFGQSVSHLFRGELKGASELADQCLSIANETGDNDLLLEAEFAVGNKAFWLANFSEAEARVQRVFELFDPERVMHHVQRFAQNPRMTCLTYGAWTAAVSGHFSLARARGDEAWAMADGMNHDFSRAIARQIQGITSQILGERENAGVRGEDLLRLAGEFPIYRTTGQMLSGWAALEAAPEDALREMMSAWGVWQAMGAGLAASFYGLMLAEGHWRVRAYRDGLNFIDVVIDGARARQELAFESELLRWRGELLHGAGSEEAIPQLTAAVSLARERRAPTFVLSASTTLARIQAAMGDRDAARSVLELALRELPEPIPEAPNSAQRSNATTARAGAPRPVPLVQRACALFSDLAES
ncbi:MAG: serine/threonine-protein kinase PknK [Polyangiaceae bacterium]